MTGRQNVDLVQRRMHETSQRSFALLKDLKEAEEEIDSLKAYVIDLKARVPDYVPASGDATDRVLADLLNKHAEKPKLKIIIMRQQPGAYLFGTKKVQMKLDG